MSVFPRRTVDDIELTKRAFARSPFANDVEVARDGTAALDRLLGPDAGPLPALVLLDLKLPRVNGLEVLQRLRADERTRALPIVILTSSSQDRDIGIIRDTTRSTYRPLLEAGIRVFEWNGPMMHAKTAVFDGRFSRVGSTNLNIASWFGNYELDVLVEDEGFGQEMQEMFRRDHRGPILQRLVACEEDYPS